MEHLQDENGNYFNGKKWVPMITVAGHQPDLLPYSGVFYKLAKADIFDVKCFDQYVNRGYQRRVMMREKWASLPISDSGGSYAPINEKKIGITAPSVLCDIIRARYQGAKFYDERSPEILDKIMSLHTEHLWQFNLELLIFVRDLLGIDTPISIAKPTIGGGSEGLVSVLKRYKGITHYLSGTGARAYMGDCKEFHDAGIEVIWSKHKPVTGDSILSVIFDHESPLDIVLAEEEN